MKTLKYRFEGPHKSPYSDNDYCVGVFDQEWKAELGGFDLGFMQRSEYVGRQITKLKNVVAGSDDEFSFGGDSSLIVDVRGQKCILCNDLLQYKIAEVPTTDLLQLMIEWHAFLKSKGF